MNRAADQTMQILRQYNIIPKRKYGQNFLVNSDIARKIVQAANINPDSIVLEIGAGLGALSSIIAPQVKQFIGFEIDADLCRVLRAELGKYPHVQIIENDFLKVTEAELQTLCGQSEVIVISNLPYYITSEIINRILTSKIKVRTFVAMLQKEVAKRITQTQGGKDVNELTIYANYFADVTYIMDCSKNNFFPRPNVDSAVLKFSNIDSSKADNDFLIVLKALFVQRRKTLYNNLIQLIPDPTLVLDGFVHLHVSATARAEDLSLDTLASIGHYFKSYLKKKE